MSYDVSDYAQGIVIIKVSVIYCGEFCVLFHVAGIRCCDQCQVILITASVMLRPCHAGYNMAFCEAPALSLFALEDVPSEDEEIK